METPSQSKPMPIIKIDFDGTIVTEAWPKIGTPISGAIETIKILKNHGYNLILWTCRHGDHLDEAIEFLRSHGVEFDVVNDHHPNSPYHNLDKGPKPYAQYHIDDKNFGGLPSWWDIQHYFLDVKPYHIN